MRDWVISVGTGPSQAPLIRTASRSGYLVLGVDRTPDHSLVDASLAVSTYETDQVLNTLAEHPQRSRVRAILARTSGPAIKTAVLLADSLNLPSFGAGFANASISKSALRKAATSVGAVTVGGETTSSPPDWIDGADWVVKPDKPLFGKRNVYRVQREAQLGSAFAAAAEESVNSLVEIQPYHPGRDLGLVTAVINGEPKWNFLFEEFVAESQERFIGRGVAGPAQRVSPNTYRDIQESAARLSNLWSSTGFAFFSYRLTTSGEPLLYEANPGLCGDEIAEKLFPALWPDTDFFALDLGLMTGGDPAMPPQTLRRAALLDGVLLTDERMEDALSDE